MPGAGEGPIPSDEDSGGKDADGAFPYGLDRMADAYVDLLHAAGYGKAIWVGLSMGGYLILDINACIRKRWRRSPCATRKPTPTPPTCD